MYVWVRVGGVPGGGERHPSLLQPSVGQRLPGAAGGARRPEKRAHHGRGRGQHHHGDHRGVWRWGGPALLLIYYGILSVLLLSRAIQ